MKATQFISSTQYLSLKQFLSQYSYDELDKTVLTPRKSLKLNELFQNYLQTLHLTNENADIISSTIKILVSRPEIRDVNRKYAENLAKLLGLPDGSGEKEIVDEVIQLRGKNESNVSLKIEFVKYKTEIERLKKQIDQITLQSAAKDQNISKLNEKLQEYYPPEKVKRILAQAKKKVDDDANLLSKADEKVKLLTIENNELREKISLQQNQIENNPKITKVERLLLNKDTEISHLLKIFDELRDQIENQSKELNKVIDDRNVLIITVQKQSLVVQKCSSYCETMRSENAKLKSQQGSLEKIINEKKLEIDDVMTAISSMIPEEIETAKIDLNNSNQTYKARITSAISKIIDFAKSNNVNAELQESNKRINILENLVSSSIELMHNIIDSTGVKPCADEPSSQNKAQLTLKCEVDKISKFIAENGIDLPHPQEICNMFMITPQTIDSKIEISNLIENLQSPQTSKEAELLSLVIQLIQVNFALRKYSENTKKRAEQFAAEVKSLNADLQQAQDSLEAVKKEEETRYTASLSKFKEDYEVMQRKLDQIKNLALAAKISPIDIKKIIDDNYEEESATDFCDASSQREEKPEEVVLPDETTEKINELEKQIEELHQQHSEKINAMEESMKSSESKYMQEMKMLQDQLDILQHENQELNNQIESTQSELIPKNDDASEQKVEKLKKEKAQLENQILNIKEAAELTVKSVAAKIKRRMRQNAEEYLIKEEEFKQNEQKLNDMISELNGKIQDAIEVEQHHKDVIEELNSTIKEKEAENRNLTAKNSVLSTQLSQCYDRMQREIASFDGQMKARVIAIEAEYKSRLEKQTKLIEEDLDRILGVVTKIVPQNDSDLEEYATELDCRLSTLASADEELAKLQSEMKQIRSILKVSKASSIQAAASSIMKEYENIGTKLSTAEEKIRSMKKEVIEARSISHQSLENVEWTEWSRKICDIVSPGTCETGQALRNKVEDIVQSNIGIGKQVQYIDSLRTQKLLLLSKFDLKKSTDPCIKTIAIAIMSIRRMKNSYDHHVTREQTPFFDNLIN